VGICGSLYLLAIVLAWFMTCRYYCAGSWALWLINDDDARWVHLRCWNGPSHAETPAPGSLPRKHAPHLPPLSTAMAWHTYG